MISLLYVSTARTKLGTEELDSILATSRRNNERDGITGMLVYCDGNFMQAVEGDAAKIDELQGRLANDLRHHQITIIARYPVEERQFPDWSMGYRRISDAGSDEIAQAFVSLRKPLFVPGAAGASSIAHKLLEGFVQGNPG